MSGEKTSLAVRKAGDVIKEPKTDRAKGRQDSKGRYGRTSPYHLKKSPGESLAFAVRVAQKKG